MVVNLQCFQSPQFINYITLNSLANEQSFHKSFSKVEHHCNRWSWCRSCLPCISWSKRQPRPPHCYFGKDLQGKRCPRYVEKVYEFTCHNIYISIILNHIMIFGVRPFVVFPLPPPPWTKNPGWVLKCLLQGIFNNFLLNQLPMV